MKKFSAIFKSIFFSFVFLTMAVFGIGGAVLSEQAPEETSATSAGVEAQSTTPVAYLHRNWISKIGRAKDKVKSITFTDVMPSGNSLCSVGSLLVDDTYYIGLTQTSGNVDYVETEGVADVLAYVVTDSEDDNLFNITLYAPGTICAPTDSGGLFRGFTVLKSIDFNGKQFDTVKCKEMDYIFYDCKSLTDIDLSGFNTQKVVNMSYAFAHCSSLKVLDMHNLYFGGVENTTGIFSGSLLLNIVLPYQIRYDETLYLPGNYYNKEKKVAVGDSISQDEASMYSSTQVKIHRRYDLICQYPHYEGWINGFYLETHYYVDLEEDQTVTLSSSTREFNTVYFTGWEFGSNTLGVKATISGDVLTIPAGAYGRIDINGWEYKKFNISFVTNTHETFDPIEYYSLSNDNLVLPMPSSRVGYVFEGWDITQNSQNETATITENCITLDNKDYGDMILTAHWTLIDYDIILNENGADDVEDLVFNISNENQTLTLPSLNYTGYKFLGWQFENNTEGVISSVSGNILSVPASAYGNLTIKANWEAIDYVVSINENGASDVADLTFNISDEIQTKTLPTLTRKGYSFNGWTIVANVTGTEATINGNQLSIPANAYGNVIVKANWTVNSYNVTLELDGAEFDGQTSFDLDFGTAYGQLPTLEKEGYTFKGWYLDEEFTQQVTAESLMNVDGDHKLYAKFEKINFFETTTGYIVLGAGGVVALGALIGCIAGIAKARKKRKRI